MKKINSEDIDKYNEDEYVWYACYGSNINLDRLMIYINGDKNGKFGHVEGCCNKDKPLEAKPYIFNCPIYFAKHSKRWNGGVAFLDYENEGKSYGKIYKMKMEQFKGVLKQESGSKAYDAIIYVGDYENLPIFTFTSSHKRDDLELPSKEYRDVIKKGLLDTYTNLKDEDVEKYFESINNSEVLYEF